MLRELRIRNFAIIDELHPTFGEGLNILTGETGAGKSIIIDAVGLALGERASSEVIRSGFDEAIIEAIFQIKEDSKAFARLKKMELLTNGDELFVKRIISKEGRNRLYLNDNLINLSTLADLGEELIDIHGQHEHQSLLKTDTHIDILDASSGLLDERKSLEEGYKRWRDLQREISDLRGKEMEATRQEEYLRFQQKEIMDAQLKVGEDEELEREKKILGSAVRLSELSDTIHQRLYSDEGAMVEELKKIINNMREIFAIDDSLSDTLRLCQEAAIQLTEVANNLRDYRDKIEPQPERLEAIEERLDRINRLKKKYGRNIDDILRYLEKIDQELSVTEKRGEQIERLAKEKALIEGEVFRLAKELSLKRKKGAEGIQKKVERELAEIQMGRTRFLVRIKDGEGDEGQRITPKGIDKVEFLISPNPGEEPRPLVKIASGGELSRVMLAIKVVLAKADKIPTLIFDEVDAGIGGAVAEVVGRKLKLLSNSHQVFCITHLPQIASFADNHYKVEKVSASERTVVHVAEMKGQERIGEIARMLGGKRITETTFKHAAEMLRIVGQGNPAPTITG